MGSDLTVITCANTDHHHFKEMVQSSKKHGLDLIVFGMGEPWMGLRDKIKFMYGASAMIDSNILMLVDAFDTIFMEGERTILDRYEKHRGKILFSAEKACWPCDQLVSSMYVHHVDTPWKFLNSGGWMGPPKLISDLLTKSWDAWNSDYDAMMGDQFFYHHLYLDNPSCITLDTGCEIFQCMAHHGPDEFVMGDNYVENVMLKTRPAVLHFNGKTDMEAYLKYAQ